MSTCLERRPVARPAAVTLAVVLTYVGAALAAVFVAVLLTTGRDGTAPPVAALLLGLWLVLAAAAGVPAIFIWRASNVARWLLFGVMVLYAVGNLVLCVVIYRLEIGRFAGPAKAYLVSTPYFVLGLDAVLVAVLLMVEHQFFAHGNNRR